MPPPDPEQTEGYLVVLKADPALAQWVRERSDKENADSAAYVAALRHTLSGIDPAHYRGIARSPIDRWWEKEPRGEERDGLARLRIWERYGPDPTLEWKQPPWFDPDLLPTRDVAEEILSLTDNPSERELLCVVRGDTACGSDTLGFDVGHWGGKHFSIIADTMVMPRWHVCPEKDLAQLVPWGRSLNQHLLFSTAPEAAAYLAWYATQAWAESNADKRIQIIRADLALPG